MLAPPAVFVSNRVQKGKPRASLPAEKHIVVIGGGIVGLTTSFYLSLDPKVNVTLMEKNKAVL
jgi:heterodisulfide reductase subunit A-like polyferredoxin